MGKRLFDVLKKLVTNSIISVETYTFPAADGLTGTYIETRYANGKMELVGKFPWKEAILTTKMAVGVYSSTYWRSVGLKFPNAFVEEPRGFINPLTSGYTLTQLAGRSATGASFRMWGSYSQELPAGYVDLYFIGRWK